MKRKLFYLFLLLALLHVQISEAIWCFSCASQTKAECGDDFRIATSDANSRSWCDGSCVKRRGTRTSGQVRRVEINRSCILRRSEGCYDESYNGISVYTCACNNNFCNSSTRERFSLFMLVTAFFTAGVLSTQLSR